MQLLRGEESSVWNACPSVFDVDDDADFWLQAQADAVQEGAEGRIVARFRHALATVSDAGEFTKVGHEQCRVVRHIYVKHTLTFSARRTNMLRLC